MNKYKHYIELLGIKFDKQHRCNNDKCNKIVQTRSQQCRCKLFKKMSKLIGKLNVLLNDMQQCIVLCPNYYKLSSFQLL